MHPTAFIDDSAQVIGDVEIGEESSVWMTVVLRGDVHWIRIGRRTNIQDGCVVHGMTETHPTAIGDGVTVGHGAIVHGATIGDDSLVGMGATLLNGSRVGPETLIGAQALIGEGKEFPPRTLLLGIPAQVKRELDDAAVVTIRQSADSYVERAQRYRGEGLDR